MANSRKVNIGCGPYKEGGYINIDINPIHNPDIVRDVTRGLPFDSDSVSEIRAYHFLEHLDNHDTIFVIKECYRVLIDGGMLDIVVPLGNSGELDHKMQFTETSFDLLLLSEDTRINFDTQMYWGLINKETFQQKTLSLRVVMRKNIKANS